MIRTAMFESALLSPGSGLGHCRAIVTAADAAGFDAAFFVRSRGQRAPMIDGAPLIAALASLPVGIGLGAGIPFDYSEPFHLARAYAAIDRLTSGRSAIVVDLAAGDDLADAIGRCPPEVPRYDRPPEAGRYDRPTEAGRYDRPPEAERDDRAPEAERYDRLLEFFDATTKLWDSWEDDAILVDRPAGLFTNPDKIHRIDHDGAWYAVRGPLNAPRPLQGRPVIVVPVTDAASRGFASRVADIALVCGETPEQVSRESTAIREAANGRVVRVLATISASETRLISECRDSRVCDGFNLLLPGDHAAIAAAVRMMPAPIRRVTGMTLRDRLDLPRPASRYAA
jgi:alkanesulfonate monooxygenase SsuD/methylene tetrahydromethanopterin reductase-like flavin-dependent oxidoreductase (luciferase family)